MFDEIYKNFFNASLLTVRRENCTWISSFLFRAQRNLSAGSPGAREDRKAKWYLLPHRGIIKNVVVIVTALVPFHRLEENLAAYRPDAPLRCVNPFVQLHREYFVLLLPAAEFHELLEALAAVRD